MKYKYLTYAIDKHQSSPSFRNDLPDWLRKNADEGYDVIVDIENNKRYWRGEWKDVDCYELVKREGKE